MRWTTSFLTAIALPLAVVATLRPASASAQPPPYGYYPGAHERTADVRVLVTPKDAQVYVDGYYAGLVDDFDGLFQRLRLEPGEHDITLYLNGFRTVHERVNLGPGATYKLRYTMERLQPGDIAEPPPTAPGIPPVQPAMPPAPGVPRTPPMPPAPPMPPPARTPPPPSGRSEASAFGTLVIRVQPGGADLLIDGQPWHGPEGDERLLVQVSQGTHRIEVRKAGYRPFVTEVRVGGGETTPLNVSLPPER